MKYTTPPFNALATAQSASLIKKRKNRNIYQNYFAIFRKYALHFVYIRLKQTCTDNFKNEYAITAFFTSSMELLCL